MTENHGISIMNEVKILVVDDNLINQKVAVKMLERLNLLCDTAYNGLEAVEAFKNRRYELILMDVQMPDMDGLEATKVIRSMEGTAYHTPIVAITANAMIGDRERCINAGMDDYLSKPILQKDIDAITNKWLASASKHTSGGDEHDEPAAAPIIDPNRIEQIKEIGDIALLKELMTLYLDDLRQFSADVVSAHRSNNFQQIYEMSHKLKGSSANLGVESIRQACTLLEQEAKDLHAENIAQQITSMQTIIEQTRLHIVKTYFG